VSNLLEAIWAWYETTTVGALIPGGLWINRAPAETGYPVAVMTPLGTAVEVDTSPTATARNSIRFAVRAADKETARRAATTLRAALWTEPPQAPLAYTGGVEIQRFPRSGSITLAAETNAGGDDLWQAYFQFDFLCQETASGS
jgi:hypothetical protein